ncbi:hypothetical protein XENTR_v10009826 [Xenopus tropicalis]|nr:hypothetical protein XENTR_v10009826 [Xenopus tropicalis]
MFKVVCDPSGVGRPIHADCTFQHPSFAALCLWSTWYLQPFIIFKRMVDSVRMSTIIKISKFIASSLMCSLLNALICCSGLSVLVDSSIG